MHDDSLQAFYNSNLKMCLKRQTGVELHHLRHLKKRKKPASILGCNKDRAISWNTGYILGSDFYAYRQLLLLRAVRVSAWSRFLSFSFFFFFPLESNNTVWWPLLGLSKSPPSLPPGSSQSGLVRLLDSMVLAVISLGRSLLLAEVNSFTCP